MKLVISDINEVRSLLQQERYIYGGTSRNNVTGKTENLVAILILRPELLIEFVYIAK